MMKNFAQTERDALCKFLAADFHWEDLAQPSSVNRMTVPVSEARVALITTGGAYIKGEQPRFHMGIEGDASFRELPGSVSLNQLRLSHSGYDTKLAMKDINVVFPLDRLRERAEAGDVGTVGPRHFSFMGYTPHIEPLFDSAREVASRLAADRIDLVLLVPA